MRTSEHGANSAPVYFLSSTPTKVLETKEMRNKIRGCKEKGKVVFKEERRDNDQQNFQMKLPTIYALN